MQITLDSGAEQFSQLFTTTNGNKQKLKTNFNFNEICLKKIRKP